MYVANTYAAAIAIFSIAMTTDHSLELLKCKFL